jgi:hypothetical protein
MKMRTYLADYEDDNFETIIANTDNEAYFEALDHEEEHGTLYNLFEIDDDYNKIREVK